MEPRLYILGTAIGSLSIGVGLGTRGKFVRSSIPAIHTTVAENVEAPDEKRNSDEKEGTPSMGEKREKRENPAGKSSLDAIRADYFDYVKSYSQSRDKFEDDSSETGDPEEDESDSDTEPQQVYEVFDDAEAWAKHPDGYQPITLTLYAEEDLCMDANGMFVDPNKLQELIGPEAYDKVYEEQSPDKSVIFHIRNHVETLDIQLIVSADSYYETRYGKDRKGKKGGKFRDSEY